MIDTEKVTYQAMHAELQNLSIQLDAALNLTTGSDNHLRVTVSDVADRLAALASHTAHADLRIVATQKTQKSESFDVGQVLGHIALSEEAVSHACSLAAEYFECQKKIDFCGDPVELQRCPAWAIDSDDWIPTEALQKIGLWLSHDNATRNMVATVGVQQHIDQINGLTFCLVLHNDGFKFRQGRKAISPVAGDWFIFDDRINHGVKESSKSTTFVAIVLSGLNRAPAPQ